MYLMYHVLINYNDNVPATITITPQVSILA